MFLFFSNKVGFAASLVISILVTLVFVKSCAG
jgi:hypothetical protein